MTQPRPPVAVRYYRWSNRHRWFGMLAIFLLLMAFVPGFATNLIAVMLVLTFLVFGLCLMAFLAKGFAILGIEVWFVKWLYKRKT